MRNFEVIVHWLHLFKIHLMKYIQNMLITYSVVIPNSCHIKLYQVFKILPKALHKISYIIYYTVYISIQLKAIF